MNVIVNQGISYRSGFSWLLILQVAIFVALAPFSLSMAQEEQPFREWNDATGKKKIYAKMLSLKDSTVQLELESGETKSINISKFSEKDRAYAVLSNAIVDDMNAFDVVVGHIPRLSSSPDAVLKILRAAEDRESSSPILPFFEGLTTFMVSADYAKAEKHFATAIKRIEALQKHNPNVHRKTQLSALNNKAICDLKQFQGVAAINSLVAASKDRGFTPFVVYHNGTLILDFLTSNKKSVIKIGDSSQKRLATLLGTKPPQAPGVQVPKRFLFTFDIDAPLTLEQVLELLGMTSERGGTASKPGETNQEQAGNSDGQEKSNVRSLSLKNYVKYATGSGFFIAPTVVATNKHVAASNSDTFLLKLETSDGHRHELLADFVASHPEPKVDLSLLSVKQGQWKPLPIADQLPEVGEDITILGYPQIRQLGEGITSTSGSINKVTDREMFTDAIINAGNSGGPCLDFHGNVCGVAFATTTFSNADTTETERGILVPAPLLRSFYKNRFSNGELLAPLTMKQESRPEVVKNARDSVVLIEVWRSRESVEKEVVATNNTSQKKLFDFKLVEDDNCMQCRGKGKINCTDGCTGGTLTRYRQMEINRDPRTGAVQTANVPYDVPCQRCSGTGRVDCPHCNNGKLR